MDTRSVSFCIADYGSAKDSLQRCVESIHALKIERYEIIVIGRATPANNGVQYIPENGLIEQKAFNKMRNLLLDASTMDHVALLEPEITFPNDWYKDIGNFSSFEIMGCRLVSTQGNRILDWAYQFYAGNSLLSVPLDYSEWTKKAYVSGALMIIKRDILGKLRFDESIKYDGDIDLCARATEMGYRVGVNPNAVATYHGSMRISSSINNVNYDDSLQAVNESRKLLAMGGKAFDAGDYKTAIECYKSAGDPEHLNIIALGKLGWALYFVERYGDAVKIFQMALSKDTQNEYCLRGLGWAKLQLKQYKDSIRSLTDALKIISLDNKNAWLEAQRGLAWANYHSGGYKMAISTFMAMVEQYPNSEKEIMKDIYSGLGWSHLRINEFDEAITYFKLALDNVDGTKRDEIKAIGQGLEHATKRHNPSEGGGVFLSPGYNQKLYSLKGLARSFLSRAKGKIVRTIFRK